MIRFLHRSAAASQLSVDFPDVEKATVDDVACVHPQPSVPHDESLCLLWMEDCASSHLCGSVKVTFVNYMGERKTLRGRVGQSLTQLAAERNYEFLSSASWRGARRNILEHFVALGKRKCNNERVVWFLWCLCSRMRWELTFLDTQQGCGLPHAYVWRRCVHQAGDV